MLEMVGSLQTELDKIPNDLRIYVSAGDNLCVITGVNYDTNTGDVTLQTEQAEHQELFEEVFNQDPDGHDTRYAGGVENLYVDVMAKLYNGTDFRKEVEQFMNETIKWHEERRWSFQPHPDFEKRILDITSEQRRQSRGEK